LGISRGGSAEVWDNGCDKRRFEAKNSRPGLWARLLLMMGESIMLTWDIIVFHEASNKDIF
jgi:hypothetical protein